MFPVFFIFSSQLWADCLDWSGLSSSTHPILSQTKYVSLLVDEVIELDVDEQECVDVNTCVWSLTPQVGTLNQEAGANNVYTAPAALGNCEPETTVLALQCQDGSGDDFRDSAEITITCGDEVDDSNPSYWTASGGGCNSPSALIIPLMLCFRRKKPKCGTVQPRSQE